MSVDIKLMESVKNVTFLNADIFEDSTKYTIEKFFKGDLDIIVSDMAADTTGNKSLDAIRTNKLCMEIINFSKKVLKPNGVFVSKLFMGEDFEELKKLAKSTFRNINFFKPESSRDVSRETYLYCKILKTL